MWLQEPWVSWKSWLVDLSTVSHALGSSVLVPEKQTLYDLPSLGPHSRPRCPAPGSPEGLAGLVWTLSPSAAITGQRPDSFQVSMWRSGESGHALEGMKSLSTSFPHSLP